MKLAVEAISDLVCSSVCGCGVSHTVALLSAVLTFVATKAVVSRTVSVSRNWSVLPLTPTGECRLTNTAVTAVLVGRASLVGRILLVSSVVGQSGRTGQSARHRRLVRNRQTLFVRIVFFYIVVFGQSAGIAVLVSRPVLPCLVSRV